MVCSFCRRKYHTRTTCNVRSLGNYDSRKCTGMDSTTAVRSCAHCTCNVRHSGESGNHHLLCPTLHSTHALSYPNLRPPVKSDDCRIAGVMDHLATLGSTFACGCCSSRAPAMDKKSRTGRVCTSEFSDLNLDLTLGGPYNNSQVPLSGKKGVESEIEVADAPGGMRLQHQPTPASSFQSASADNHIEDGRWSTEEHARFLMGLKDEGKGRRKQISERHVKTRTTTQVSSHTQKYFLRHKNPKRRSINDIRNEADQERP